MKINKFKAILIAICCLLVSMWSETLGMEKSIFDNEKSFTSSREIRQFYLTSISESNNKDDLIVGAFKIQNEALGSQDIMDAIRGLSDVDFKVFLEDRHSPEEVKSIIISDESNKEIIKNLEERKKTIRPTYCQNVHIKVLLKNDLCMVSTTNYDKEFSEEYQIRDFSVTIKDSSIKKELRDVLVSETLPEFQKYEISSLNDDIKTCLTWPPHHKQQLIELICKSKTSIKIYQQDIQDSEITYELLKKANLIEIIMSKYPFGKKDSKGNKREPFNKNITNLSALMNLGAKIKLTKKKDRNCPLHIHAKVLIIDDEIMYLGSANFYPNVLNYKEKEFHLNVGIITKNQSYIEPVNNQFKKDWGKIGNELTNNEIIKLINVTN